jgi:hypothetical protein
MSAEMVFFLDSSTIPPKFHRNLGELLVNFEFRAIAGVNQFMLVVPLSG